jgi:hypothetical protein
MKKPNTDKMNDPMFVKTRSMISDALAAPKLKIKKKKAPPAEMMEDGDHSPSKPRQVKVI